LFTDMPMVADERLTSGAPLEYRSPPAQYRTLVCDRGDARRDEAESFIRRRYLRTHGAQISTFMPSLLLLVDGTGALAAAAGFRCAAQEPLFLERYLPVSIEQAVAAHTTTPVRRADIVEIGNFAALDARRAQKLMSFMPALFLERRARWITFTATAAIRNILASMGAHCLEIGAADGDRAGSSDEWGRYYSNDPKVMAGFLPSARRIPALWRSHHGD
jgi:Thermostable hemolysin